MTAPIEAIGGLTSVAPTMSIGPIDRPDGAAGTGGADFAAKLSSSLQNLTDLQAKADDLSVQAATGSLTDVHDYMIASSEAALATQLTVAVRNKAVEAFNEIMRMQA